MKFEKKFNIELIKYPTDEDWQVVKTLTLNTIGKKSIAGKEIALDWKRGMLKCEHSPIRYLQFIIKMDIPYCDSVCFVRHKYGCEHFVSSQRNDRQDKFDRYQEPQGHIVSHMMLVNAQELMFIANRRLCKCASENCQIIMKQIKELVEDKCPEFKGMLVPMCVRNGGKCREMFPCEAGKKMQEKELEK